ncbi:hypothetical protein [Legionella clemsonensis]|uniref:Purine NTPase n=1 Tax=Legionella clemsonensis TaxID=1867846 RepID=A0A222NZU0_9GAMM|nr:hypothetical protein [Legionella clemsonensis]ASQ45089.1 hypothetical protein clem_02640 [Legionella clemsonensis]
MTKRGEHFSELFYHWRLDKAKNEESVLLTVLDIDAYLQTVLDLKNIKNDFHHVTSLNYIALNRYGKREFGALVYCKFIIQDYFACAGEEEQVLLNAIMENIDGLYIQGRVDTQTKLNSLIASCHLWLDNYTQNRVDVFQIKSLCCTLYLLLKVLEIFLKNLGGWSKQLAKPFVDLNSLIHAIDNLLAKTEERFNAINTSTLLEEKSIIPQNLAEFFDKKYLKIAATNPTERYDLLLEKVSLLKTLVTDTRAVSMTLKKRHEVEKRIQNAQALLDLMEDNARRVIGRKYFLELIEENDKYFQDVMNCLDSEEKTALLEKVEQLKKPTSSQKVYSSVQYGVSYVTALPTSAFRLTVPQDWQNYVVSVIPDTLDSQCKGELKFLIETALKKLKKTLADTETELQILAEKFPADKERYEQFIKSKISPEVIEQMIISSEVMMNSLAMYENLLSYANKMREISKEIYALNEKIDCFLQLHNGFWVKLSNFLARFFSVFKTETAKLVGKVQAIQSELNALKQEYTSNFKKACDVYLQKQGILHPQLHHLLTKEAKSLGSLIEIPKKAVMTKTTMHASFSHIRQCFFYLKEDAVQLAETNRVPLRI